MADSKEFLDKTLQVWQPHSKQELTHEDARELAQDMVNLVKFLATLDKKQLLNER